MLGLSQCATNLVVDSCPKVAFYKRGDAAFYYELSCGPINIHTWAVVGIYVCFGSKYIAGLEAGGMAFKQLLASGKPFLAYSSG